MKGFYFGRIYKIVVVITHDNDDNAYTETTRLTKSQFWTVQED